MSIIVSPILRSPLERFHLSKPIRLEGRHHPSIRFVVLTGLLRPMYHGVNLHPGQLRVPFKQPATNLPASLQKTVILRIHNPSEKGAETRSSQAPTADRSPLLFHGACRPFGVYIRLIPRPRQRR